MRAVIYARFSPRPGAAECDSIAAQTEACRAYCARLGHEVVAEFADAAESGADEERPGLWAAIQAAPRGGALVVAKVDRLARSVYLDEAIRRQLRLKGAFVDAVDARCDDSDPNSVLVRQIMAAVAEWERKIIAGRTRAAMLRHQANGHPMGSRPPFGLKRDGSRLVPCSAEVRVIRRILAMRAAGRSLRGIAQALTEERVPCRGTRWHATTIRRIIRRQAASTIPHSAQ